jgi:hypothetical protein
MSSSAAAGSGRANSTQGTWVAEVDSLLARARAELSGLIATSSPTTKTICCVLGVSYIVNFVAPWAADYFALVPERTIPCVWNIVREIDPPCSRDPLQAYSPPHVSHMN